MAQAPRGGPPESAGGGDAPPPVGAPSAASAATNVALQAPPGRSTREWLGLTRDVVNAGAAGADIGFKVARQSSRVGFTVAANVLTGLSWLGSCAAGGCNTASSVLAGVSEIVAASGKATDSALSASHYITKASLGTTSDVLLACGATRGELLRAMGLDGDTADALIAVGKLSTSFGDELCMTPALIQDLAVLRELQGRAGMRLTREVCPDTPGHSLEVHRAVPREEHAEALAYLPFALAAYSSRMHTFMGIRRMLQQRRQALQDSSTMTPSSPSDTDAAGSADAVDPSASLPLSGSEVIEGTHDDLAHIADITGVCPADVLLQKWSTAPYNPSHYVAVDRAGGAVVVGFRGTCSISDALTDLICDHVECTVQGMEGRAHRGFYEAAQRLAPQLEPVVAEGLRALERDGGDRLHRVVLTGHSLGAAVATSLAAYWLARGGTCAGAPVDCYAYAPPCVFDLPLADHPVLRERIRSVVIGDDLVPRLCHGSAWDVRGRLLQLQNLRSTAPHEYDRLAAMLHEDATEAALPEANARAAYTLLEPTSPSSPRLYPAGTVYYAFADPTTDSQGTPRSLVRIPHKHLSDLVLSSTMFSDHMPQVYAGLLIS